VNYTDPKGLCPMCWAVIIATLEIWELQQAADEGVPGGGFCKGGATPLYRAVKPDELEDILKTGQFINRGSAEGKYFTSSAEHASDYAKQAVEGFLDPPYTIIKTEIPTSSLPSPTFVDGGIPAYVLPNNALPGMVPQPMTSMPIPR